MTVPTLITDLSTTAGSNSPSGSETPAEGDNHLRAAYSFIAQVRDKLNGTDSATVTVQNLSVTGNTTLGDAGADIVTLNGTFQKANGSAIAATSGASGSYTSFGIGRTAATEGFLSVAGAANNFITGSVAGDITLNTSGGSLLFGPGSTLGLKIDASGNAGVGVSPGGGAKLDILADATNRFRMTGSGGSLYLDSINAAASANLPLVVRASTHEFRIGSAGATLSMNAAGVVNLSAGSGSITLAGAVTRMEWSAGVLAVNGLYSTNIFPRVPDSALVYLECLTTEAGYAVGDYVAWSPLMTGFGGGYHMYFDASTANLKTINATVQIPNKVTSAATSLTPANWRIRVRATFL